MKQQLYLIIKNFVNQLYNVIYFLILRLKKNRRRKLEFYFSLCAIFKDEAPYIREWIEFHKLIGVDHIYLYDNFSKDNYSDVLEEYINNGYVTLKKWPFEKGQISAYEDCFQNYSGATQWLMFLDLDEFICPKYETDIKKWIIKFEKYPSIILYWLMFGTNGIIEYNKNKLVLEQYTNSWESVRNVGKIILNTDFEPCTMYQHHIFSYLKFFGLKFKVPSINEHKKFIFYPGKEKCPKKGTIQINHYWSKCLNEYIRKIDKGSAFSIKNEEIKHRLDFFYWHEYQNISDNKVIWRFLVELKRRLNSIDIKFGK